MSDRDFIVARFWDKVEKTETCWIWKASTIVTGLPYGLFKLKRKTRLAHRVAYELFVGPIPDDLCVLHKCDNPRCVRPDHLWVGTNADNSRDACDKRRARGVIRRGIENPMSKLTDDRVRAIREMYASGNWSQNGLGKFFDVSQTQIGLIVRHKNWAHVV